MKGYQYLFPYDTVKEILNKSKQNFKLSTNSSIFVINKHNDEVMKRFKGPDISAKDITDDGNLDDRYLKDDAEFIDFHGGSNAYLYKKNPGLACWLSNEEKKPEFKSYVTAAGLLVVLSEMEKEYNSQVSSLKKSNAQNEKEIENIHSTAKRNWLQQRFSIFRFKENRAVNAVKSRIRTNNNLIDVNTFLAGKVNNDIHFIKEEQVKYEIKNEKKLSALKTEYDRFVETNCKPKFVSTVNPRGSIAQNNTTEKTTSTNQSTHQNHQPAPQSSQSSISLPPLVNHLIAIPSFI